MSWRRVTRRAPCPVCGRPDWCGITDDGAAVCCMRTPSDRPLPNGGWLHNPDGAAPPPPPPPRRPAPAQDRVQLEEIALAAVAAAGIGGRRRLAAQLGLDAVALDRLRVGWSEQHSAWTAPMRDGRGKVIGVHLRSNDGRKRCIRGSRLGLFYAPDLLQREHHNMWCPEGMTDAAALLGLGLPAVGRPSNRGGLALLRALSRRVRPSALILVADADQPGREGAAAIARRLAPHVRDVVVVEPPCGAKDARAAAAAGATAQDFERLASAAEPVRLRVSVGVRRKGIFPRAGAGGRGKQRGAQT